MHEQQQCALAGATTARCRVGVSRHVAAVCEATVPVLAQRFSSCHSSSS
jgi:hypothetical protein